MNNRHGLTTTVNINVFTHKPVNAWRPPFFSFFSASADRIHWVHTAQCMISIRNRIQRPWWTNRALIEAVFLTHKIYNLYVASTGRCFNRNFNYDSFDSTIKSNLQILHTSDSSKIIITVVAMVTLLIASAK